MRSYRNIFKKNSSIAFSFLTIVKKLKFLELTKFTCYPTPFPKLSKIDNLIVRQRPLRSHLPKRMLACLHTLHEMID